MPRGVPLLEGSAPNTRGATTHSPSIEVFEREWHAIHPASPLPSWCTIRTPAVSQGADLRHSQNPDFFAIRNIWTTIVKAATKPYYFLGKE